MNVLAGPVAALAVASLFYVYRHHAEYIREKHRRLRDRVAYMLWMAATGVPE